MDPRPSPSYPNDPPRWNAFAPNWNRSTSKFASCNGSWIASGGRVIPKVGAEGVYCAALPELGLGVALKVEDGDFKSSVAALVAVLDQLAPGIASVASEWRSPPVKNTRGQVVGWMQAHVPLRGDGF